MAKFTKIPENTFENLQLDAGVLLKTFDPEAATEPADADIITATKGGVTITCVPSYSDMGDDVDNAPPNMLELKKLDGWNCAISFVALDASVETIALSLGAADVVGDKVVPRRTIKTSDFRDVWWVGDTAAGGMMAVKLINALSTGGFSFRSAKNAKGEISVELTGHVSLDAQDVMPMEFYSTAATT